jgi:hypothetical protein
MRLRRKNKFPSVPNSAYKVCAIVRKYMPGNVAAGFSLRPHRLQTGATKKYLLAQAYLNIKVLLCGESRWAVPTPRNYFV